MQSELRATNAEGVGEFQPSGWSKATTLGRLPKIPSNPEQGSAIGERLQRFALISIRSQGCRCAPALGSN
jgi:hypothetical protein